MKCYWLNQNSNKKLIVFFAGWSFDRYPFTGMNCSDFDVLFVYDYNSMFVPEEFSKFSNYDEKYLISWSMGVFTAYLLKDYFSDFDRKIAVNGTVTPVDNEFGIPESIFKLTLKHAEKGLEGKFYQNLFLTKQEYDMYSTYPVRRTIEDRVWELKTLYSVIEKTEINYEKFYDIAIVCTGDKIIPPKNQIASHKKNNVPVITADYGHFPYYYLSWKEIAECRQTSNI